MTRFIAVDFFCGAGGMTQGLIQAGIHVLAGVDNEPMCEKTFKQNSNKNGSSPTFICRNIFPRSAKRPDGEQDEIITQIQNLIASYKREHRYRKVHLIFSICAPCQPFTKITKIEMSEGRQFKRSNDSNLLLTTLNLIEKFRPSALICENVEGILSGSGDVLNTFHKRLNRLGYDFDAKIINAVKFGVPQNRKRTIGIGFDKLCMSGDINIAEFDPTYERPVTVAETIGHLPPIAASEAHPSIPNHRARSLSELNLKRISCAPPGASNGYLWNTKYGDLSLACHQRLVEKSGKASFSDTYTRMSGDSVSPTITTKCMSITNGRFGHYDTSQNRGISPREAALLQTFPQDYVFYPEQQLTFTSTLIGNAVPPRLANFFGDYIVSQLSS
jgi:DNA (cytosine-5)-methyltransferase 1